MRRDRATRPVWACPRPRRSRVRRLQNLRDAADEGHSSAVSPASGAGAGVMKVADINRVIEALKPTEDRLRSDLYREVERQVESYRRSMTVRDKWCCLPLQKFAAEIWGVSQPRTEGLGTTSFKLRGVDVIYCPFCGVKV